MAALREGDYRRILTFLERLYAFDEEEAFAQWLVGEVSKLVGGHHCSWNEMSLSVPRATVVEYPSLDEIEHRSSLFVEHLFEHPGLVHYLTTGDMSPVCISDFLSAESFHRLPLYQRLFRQMAYEDQMAMCLSPPAGEVAGITVARDRRGFTQRDRQVMTLIRPHLELAHRNLRSLARARRRFGEGAEERANIYMLDVGRRNGVLRGLGHARSVLKHYFHGGRRGAAQSLPDDLRRWLRHAPSVPLRVRRGGRQLTARFFPNGQESKTGLLLLQDRAVSQATDWLQAKGLTAREAEVLLELEKGGTNDDIAAVLGIRPRTVKKHLENVYAKLGVRNRTSALAWLYRVTRDGP